MKAQIYLPIAPYCLPGWHLGSKKLYYGYISTLIMKDCIVLSQSDRELNPCLGLAGRPGEGKDHEQLWAMALREWVTINLYFNRFFIPPNCTILPAWLTYRFIKAISWIHININIESLHCPQPVRQGIESLSWVCGQAMRGQGSWAAQGFRGWPGLVRASK